MDLKNQLRLKYRKWMTENVTREFCFNSGEKIKQIIQERLIHESPLKISIFLSKFPEISTGPLIEYFYTLGVGVYVPAWNEKEMWMCYVPTKSELNDIISSTPFNKFPNPFKNDRVPIDNIIYDYIILPGLAFDHTNKHRLGYGYGHYDRFLSQYFANNPAAIAKTKLIGVGYDEQISEDPLPFEAYDIKLHEIITPLSYKK